MSEENVITLDGKDYTSKDLDGRQKYLIAQLQNCAKQLGELQASVDSIQRSRDSFQNELIESLRSTSEEEKAS